MFGPKILIRKFYDGSFEFVAGADTAKGMLDENTFDFKLTDSADIETMGRVGKILFDAGAKGIRRAYSKREFITGKKA